MGVFDGMKGNITEQVINNIMSTTKDHYQGIDPQKVADYYLKNVDQNDKDALKRAFLAFHGDIMMKCPTYFFAKQFSQNNPERKAYFFEQTYQSATRGDWCDAKRVGICHGADVEFTFGNFLSNPKSAKIDIDFSKEMMKMWTNFAKTGYGFKAK